MASRNSLVLLLCLFIAVLASVSAASQRSPLIPRDTEETVEDPEDIEDDPETLEDEPEQDEDESEQDEYEPDPYEDEPEQDEDSGPSTEKPATGSLLKFLKKTIEFLKKALGKAEKTGQIENKPPPKHAKPCGIWNAYTCPKGATCIAIGILVGWCHEN